MIKNNSIFINIAAYNEDDLVDTVNSALTKAAYPENIFIGILMQYPDKNFPDLSMYKNVKTKKNDSLVGLGLGMARGIASEFYDNEEFYLQIDAHTVFKQDWDTTLIKNYINLKEIAEKPIISSYVPYYYKNASTGEKVTMANNQDWDGNYLSWSLVPKNNKNALGMSDIDTYNRFVYGIEALLSPAAKSVDFSKKWYEEQYLISGHFLFTSSSFIKEIKYDPVLAYHEENVIAMNAWTRGYRIFTIMDHVLWTRGLSGDFLDVPNSWRQSYRVKDESGICFMDKVVAGTLRNKQILTGKILGEYGSPTQDLLDEYCKLSGIDYNKFYQDLDSIVEEYGDKYPAAKMLYDLERSLSE